MRKVGGMVALFGTIAHVNANAINAMLVNKCRKSFF